MARRTSTRKGMVRRSARRAYEGLGRRTRRPRRRAYRAIRRRGRRVKKGLIKGRSYDAMRDCGMIVAGDAAALATTRFYGPTIGGFQTPTVLGTALIGWGIYKNDKKPIYAGFGALYPMLHNRMASVIAGA